MQSLVHEGNPKDSGKKQFVNKALTHQEFVNPLHTSLKCVGKISWKLVEWTYCRQTNFGKATQSSQRKATINSSAAEKKLLKAATEMFVYFELFCLTSPANRECFDCFPPLTVPVPHMSPHLLKNKTSGNGHKTHPSIKLLFSHCQFFAFHIGLGGDK